MENVNCAEKREKKLALVDRMLTKPGLEFISGWYPGMNEMLCLITKPLAKALGKSEVYVAEVSKRINEWNSGMQKEGLDIRSVPYSIGELTGNAIVGTPFVVLADTISGGFLSDCFYAATSTL